ncbi:hypothetical protein Sfr7A_12650 [Streptomyces xinghaiensis]|uniref:Type IV secretion system protein n=2 Tax=Streptomyces TaxID=1883 RepID=A0A3R7ERV2_9ACTN|nr:hypothetical protein BEN35_18465 [Streptomyces fradiae]PQM23400.1 hypothetical protein Sfr7A_12650 [Streptomyces xinghaiensis]RKM94965.1 hypothetical protein SFRA_017120 [Streptomyces xinghaiensis]RNC74596.1 hypothetical protein DC095_007830 [Streptomyces xinghaiensis]
MGDPGRCLDKIGDKVTDGVSGAVDDAANSVVGSAVEAFAQAIGDAVTGILQELHGIWLKIGVESTDPADKIADQVDWLIGYIAVASLLVAAIRMAVDRKGQPMQQAFNGLWKVILVGATATWAVKKLSEASDAYAQYLFKNSAMGEEGSKFIGGAVIGQMITGSPGLLIVLGILVILATFVQMMLMYIRIGVVLILVGTLPLAAASSMTGWGSGWWKKHIGWLAAWLLYKPAAALIFYSASKMTEKGSEISQVVAGLGMILMAVFALPALLKLIVPATAALGGTSGGTVTVSAVNNLASGAVSIAGGAAGGGGGGGGAVMGSGGGKSGGSASSGPKGSPSTGAGQSAGASGAGGKAAGAGAGAAGGAATAGASAGVQAAAVAAQTAVAAGTQVLNSLDDNDGNKGHNE